MGLPYRVMGPRVPQLLGRSGLLRQLEQHLVKPTPDHVSVVGPARYGKSVLLYHFAEAHRSGSSQYLTTIYEDLRWDTPASDTGFRRRLSESLRKALLPIASSIATLIDPREDTHELMELALEELEQSSAKVLLVLDGFDHVLATPSLTRNLWDQLRTLAQHSSLRLVTGSRRALRELCRTEESQTSAFWEIFYDSPVVVGPFEETDWDDLVAPLERVGITVDRAARKELVNWSGGVPVLAAALLERIGGGSAPGSTCTKGIVDGVGEAMMEDGREVLGALWDDCPVDLRGDLADLSAREAEGILASELSAGRKRALESRGFGKVSGNRMRGSCRLMLRYAQQQAPAVADLKRLFGTRRGYETSIGQMLEYRLAQIDGVGVDEELRELVHRAVRDFQASPELAVTDVRSIVQRAFTIIWKAELAGGERLPEDWIQEWRGAGQIEWLQGSDRLPRRDGQQCRILRLATGAEGIRPRARFVTKPTYLLLDALQSVGDFGQHRRDFPESQVRVCFGAAIVLFAIELLESLSCDLERS